MTKPKKPSEDATLTGAPQSGPDGGPDGAQTLQADPPQTGDEAAAKSFGDIGMPGADDAAPDQEGGAPQPPVVLGASKPDTLPHRVEVGPILHDGETYHTGDTIHLTKRQAEGLAKVVTLIQG